MKIKDRGETLNFKNIKHAYHKKQESEHKNAGKTLEAG
jgi:hypothetical protein